MFGADGAPAGDALVHNTTTARDQSAPTLAGAGEFFLALFQSGGTVRGRVLSESGTPLPNRERRPTIDDFEVSPAGAMPASAPGGRDGETFFVSWATGTTSIYGRMFMFRRP